MSTFGERLKDAMLAAGIDSAEELARRWGEQKEDLMDLIASGGESGRVRTFVKLCRILRVRVQWLLDGTGPMMAVTGEDIEIEALQILRALPPEKVASWFAMGRRWGKRGL